MENAAQQIDLYNYVERSISPVRVDEGRAERVTHTIAPRKRRTKKKEPEKFISPEYIKYLEARKTVDEWNAKKKEGLPPEAIEWLEAKRAFHDRLEKGIYRADSWRGDAVWYRLLDATHSIKDLNGGVNPYIYLLEESTTLI